jgi:hypothetical protein
MMPRMGSRGSCTFAPSTKPASPEPEKPPSPAARGGGAASPNYLEGLAASHGEAAE